MSIFNRIRRFLGGASGDGGPGGGGPCEHGAEQGAGMISCEEALRLVHDFIDGELEDVPAEEVKQHFEMCKRCYPHLQLESTFRDALRRAARGTGAPPDLKDRLTEMISEERSRE